MGVFGALALPWKILKFLLISNPSGTWTSCFILALVRVLTALILLRSWIIPGLLNAASKHVRVRTTSLRSIRGIFIAAGSLEIRIERVSWPRSPPEATTRWTVTFEGLRLRVKKQEQHKPILLKRRRAFSFREIHTTSPQQSLRQWFVSAHAVLDPLVRPYLRVYAVACLRIIFQVLPHVTSMIGFEVQDFQASVADLPGVDVSAHRVHLHTIINLVGLEPPASALKHRRKSSTPKYPSYRLSVLHKRIARSFRRSWNAAWGHTQGHLHWRFSVHDARGFMQPASSGAELPFFDLPGESHLQGSVGFNPIGGLSSAQALSALLNLGKVVVDIDACLAVWNDWKAVKSRLQATYPPSELLNPPPKPPAEDDPEDSPSPPRTPPGDGLPNPVGSPFLEALSSRLRGASYYQPSCTKVADFKDNSTLAFFSSLEVRLADITFLSAEDRPAIQDYAIYKGRLQHIVLDVRRSDPFSSPLHRKHLGRSVSQLHPGSYTITFNLQEVTLDKISRLEELHVAKLGSIAINGLVSQWPSPVVYATPFLCGDPNAALLALDIRLGGMQATHNIDDIRDILDRLDAYMTAKKIAAGPPPPPKPMPTSAMLPRVIFTLHSGPFWATILGTEGRAHAPTSTELRCNEFAVSAESCFVHEKTSLMPDQGYRMTAQLQVDMDTLFVKVRRQWDESNAGPFNSGGIANDRDFLDDPSLLTFDGFVFRASASTLADVVDDTQNMATVDLHSLVGDVNVRAEILCVELWHPDVLATTAQLASLASRPRPPSPISEPPSQPKPPSPLGLNFTACIVRIAALTTSPDLNPSNAMDMALGVALRTSLCLEYANVQSTHMHHFRKYDERANARAILRVAEERIAEAIASTKTTAGARAVATLELEEIHVRDALSTEVESDDQSIAEADSREHDSKTFVGIESVKVSFTGAPAGASSDGSIYIAISEADAEIQLSHVYHALLAARAVKSLLPPRAAAEQQNVPVKKKRGKSLEVMFCLRRAEITFILRKHRLTACLRDLRATVSPEAPVSASLSQLMVWVPPSAPPTRHSQLSATNEWQELLLLRGWRVFLPTHPGSAISVEGDAARLRIPHGYILADLILEISLAVKGAKHLVHMTSAGRYSHMPTPEAEGPKNVPPLKIDVTYLAIEAADDPLENSLSSIFRIVLDGARQRTERENAFEAKVEKILGQGAESTTTPGLRPDYDFTAAHTVSIEEARRRLDEVNFWTYRTLLDQLRNSREESEMTVLENLMGRKRRAVPVQVLVDETLKVPLFRAALSNVQVLLGPPSFPMDHLAQFMHEQGDGLPLDTIFTLLVPMHIHVTASTACGELRDFPLPLLYIPPHSDGVSHALEFDTDLVIGEEMGTEASVDWFECPILSGSRRYSIPPLSISVPKTIMPVKTYALPQVQVVTDSTTTISWGISYGAATQDLMRVLDSVTSSPRDSSPAVGFWDKSSVQIRRALCHERYPCCHRLIYSLTHKLVSGSRDPSSLHGDGSGFVLVWQGNPKILVGLPNDDHEVIQVISNSMFMAIPNLGQCQYGAVDRRDFKYTKIMAKLRSGVRFGLGFICERSCGEECEKCAGDPFNRSCRLFNFAPHYDVHLEKKAKPPLPKTAYDSYNGFRSDFIHLSISLTSCIRPMKLGHLKNSSTLHLTPKTFAHFWAWWHLFDGVLSLPIRQGSYYPRRLLTPKFGRHLATLKYRISVPQLYLMHAYIDDSRQTWVEGVTPWIGVKGLLKDFQVDMHQRDQEMVVPGMEGNTTKVIRRKPFYACEVAIKDLDLRAVLATFPEPLKQAVPVTKPEHRSNYSSRTDLPTSSQFSAWYDSDDYVELDWQPIENPTLHFLPVANCPYIAYFKRNLANSPQTDADLNTKFGNEPTHTCLLDTQATIPEIQIDLTSRRVKDMKLTMDITDSESESDKDGEPLQRMVALLEEYISHLQELETRSTSKTADQDYRLPSDTVSPDEWAEFDNVIQVHCPKVFFDSAIRDIMLQYYYLSRARRGHEYHLATRAVKFILDQANTVLKDDVSERESSESAHNPAQMAALALKKIISGGDNRKSSSQDGPRDSQAVSFDMGDVNPLDGWPEGVSLHKSTVGLLLKPQIVLRAEGDTNAIAIVAAVQAKMQTFSVMDDANAMDPISGKIMSRSYASLSGLQMFSPVEKEQVGDGCVPLEVLIDLRCESRLFDRIVPQTDAIFQYDKFNRLRLRNGITSAIAPASNQKPTLVDDHHLQDQTDLIRVHSPRFSAGATEDHFQVISQVITKVLLFSDPAHKTRLDRLETLLFAYDFTDLQSAAKVVSSIQQRLRSALEMQRAAGSLADFSYPSARVEVLKLRAHIYLLSEELNLLFDAIKLAQDRSDDHTDKSAVMLHASSSEISWRMLDKSRDMLAKLVIQNADFHWLNRQDSSTVNHLSVGNLQAFDGSRDAVWQEILAKHDEPTGHPLLKRGLFLLADWTVLAPVGGITIYERFEVQLHPFRLQLHAAMGRKIMEYFWPNRREMAELEGTDDEGDDDDLISERASMDAPRSPSTLTPPPGLRKLGASRSFTDLRMSARENSTQSLKLSPLTRMRSSDALNGHNNGDGGKLKKARAAAAHRHKMDAAEMKTRSSQKSFVLVKISRYATPVMKDDSFVCRDAMIRTRDLEYRNQTWSFEELVSQFIPSNTSWTGWLKMAFHQPLVPVFPVARELIAKTKFIPSSSKNTSPDDTPQLTPTPKPSGRPKLGLQQVSTPMLPKDSKWRRASARRLPEEPATSFSPYITDEPEPLDLDGLSSQPPRPPSRNRMMSLFSRSSSSKSGKSDSSTSLVSIGFPYVFTSSLLLDSHPGRSSVGQVQMAGPAHLVHPNGRLTMVIHNLQRSTYSLYRHLASAHTVPYTHRYLLSALVHAGCSLLYPRLTLGSHIIMSRTTYARPPYTCSRTKHAPQSPPTAAIIEASKKEPAVRLRGSEQRGACREQWDAYFGKLINANISWT
ncbi:golgi-body localization protein domain-containing protein [Schizophyllum fasciatum]